MTQEEMEQVQDEPGDYVVSDFIAPCVHGDVIWKGDTIRPVTENAGEFEHKACAEHGAAVFGARLPINDPAMDDDPPYEGDGFDPYMEDLPGMWERADFIGGMTDNE